MVPIARIGMATRKAMRAISSGKPRVPAQLDLRSFGHDRVYGAPMPSLERIQIEYCSIIYTFGEIDGI